MLKMWKVGGDREEDTKTKKYIAYGVLAFKKKKNLLMSPY